MLWRKSVDLSETVNKRSTISEPRSTKLQKHDIVVIRNSQENIVPLYAMATKTRAACPLPSMSGNGDVPPPLPPSRRPVPPPPVVDEPPPTSRQPPPLPKGRPQPVPEPEPEYDPDADNTEQTYDEFEIAADETKSLPSPPSELSEQAYDEWGPTEHPSLEYEVPDEITKPKPVGKPALPSRNVAPPPVIEGDVYEDPNEDQIPEDTSNKKTVGKPSLPSRNAPPVSPSVEDVYEDPEDNRVQEELYEVPDEKSSPAPPSLPSRPTERAPLPLPSKRTPTPQKSSSSSAPGITIDTGALGSALKGLKRVTNSSSKEEPTKVEEKSTVYTKNLNFKDAINKFQQSPNEKPAMLPKPSKYSVPATPSSKSSASSISSTDSNQRPPPSHPGSSTSAKDLPLPRLPSEEASDVFDEIYDDVASNNMLLAYPWYHGELNREEAERKLKQIGENGTFLLRDSKKSPGQPYTLVLLYNNTVKNLKVRLRTDEQYALGEEKKDELTFKDVIEMIEHHKENEVILIKEKAKVKLQKTPRSS